MEDNINDFRKEIISFTDGKGDSLDNTEAYCLNTDIDTLLKNKIVLIDNNERYYFSNNKYCVAIAFLLAWLWSSVSWSWQNPLVDALHAWVKIQSWSSPITMRTFV